MINAARSSRVLREVMSTLALSNHSRRRLHHHVAISVAVTFTDPHGNSVCGLEQVAGSEFGIEHWRWSNHKSELGIHLHEIWIFVV